MTTLHSDVLNSIEKDLAVITKHSIAPRHNIVLVEGAVRQTLQCDPLYVQAFCRRFVSACGCDSTEFSASYGKTKLNWEMIRLMLHQLIEGEVNKFKSNQQVVNHYLTSLSLHDIELCKFWPWVDQYRWVEISCYPPHACIVYQNLDFGMIHLVKSDCQNWSTF